TACHSDHILRCPVSWHETVVAILSCDLESRRHKQVRRRSSSVSKCDTEQQAMTTASNGSPEPGQSRMSPFTNEIRWRTDDAAPLRASAALPSISIEESTLHRQDQGPG